MLRIVRESGKYSAVQFRRNICLASQFLRTTRDLLIAFVFVGVELGVVAGVT